MGTTDIDITEGSGKSVAAHDFTEDSITRVVERVAPGTGKITLPTTPDIASQSAAGLYPATAIDIQGKARVLIRTTMSANNVSASFRILLYDSAGTLIGSLPGPSDTYTATASEESVSEESATRYVGTFFVMANEAGAASMKIRLTEAPTNSGNISFSVCGV